MHEMTLMNGLITKMESIASEQNARRIKRVKVRLGALSHISADHFRGHFVEGTQGTFADGARLDIEISEDMDSPNAQDILLVSVDIEP